MVGTIVTARKDGKGPAPWRDKLLHEHDMPLPSSLGDPIPLQTDFFGSRAPLGLVMNYIA
jgi:hypothetical protein